MGKAKIHGGGGYFIKGRKVSIPAKADISVGDFIEVETDLTLSDSAESTNFRCWDAIDGRSFGVSTNTGNKIVFEAYEIKNTEITKTASQVIADASIGSVVNLSAIDRNTAAVLLYNSSTYSLFLITVQINNDGTVLYSAALQIETASYSGTYGTYSQAFRLSETQMALFTEVRYSSFDYAMYMDIFIFDISDIQEPLQKGKHRNSAAGTFSRFVQLSDTLFLYLTMTTDSTPLTKVYGVTIENNVISVTPGLNLENNVYPYYNEGGFLYKLTETRAIYFGARTINLYPSAAIFEFVDINTAPTNTASLQLANTSSIGGRMDGVVLSETRAATIDKYARFLTIGASSITAGSQIAIKGEMQMSRPRFCITKKLGADRVIAHTYARDNNSVYYSQLLLFSNSALIDYFDVDALAGGPITISHSNIALVPRSRNLLEAYSYTFAKEKSSTIHGVAVTSAKKGGTVKAILP